MKSICDKLDLKVLDIIINNKSFNKIDEINVEAKNVIYNNLYLNTIKISIKNLLINYKFKNNLFTLEDDSIKIFLILDKDNIKDILYSENSKKLRIMIQSFATNNNDIKDINIDGGVINIKYINNGSPRFSCLFLGLENNNIFLGKINKEGKMNLPIDKNIIFQDCTIIDQFININCKSKLILNT